MTKRANSVARYTEHGLQRVAAMHVGLEALGWGGKEAIGGELHLTTYRLLFKAHKVNRLSGSFSIFLPSISGVRNSSRGFVRGMTVTTSSQDLEFVVWGVGRLITAVEEQRRAINLGRLDLALRAAASQPALLGPGLEKSVLIDRLLREGSLSKIISNVGEIALNPFSLSTLVNVAELVELLHEK